MQKQSRLLPLEVPYTFLFGLTSPSSFLIKIFLLPSPPLFSSNLSIGVAGGAKYKVKGIIFKFSLDVPMDKVWVYGKEKRCDEKGMKSACNELKGKEGEGAWGC
jgi:hypothetical protein